MERPIQSPVKTKAELASEWDRLAEERRHLIESGVDVSFNHVLAPTTLALLRVCGDDCVVDIGCGTGHFTAQLAGLARAVVGVDPSAGSVALARQVCGRASNVRFINATLEDSVPELRASRTTSAVAMMSLMTTPNLRAVAEALSTILSPRGVFVATMCHPCFWPRYWCYESEGWFDYSAEVYVEAPFATSKSRSVNVTTHVHRPLGEYLKVFRDAGFTLDAFEEPMPSVEVEKLYPEPWKYPRFVSVRWVKSV